MCLIFNLVLQAREYLWSLLLLPFMSAVSMFTLWSLALNFFIIDELWLYIDDWIIKKFMEIVHSIW